MTLNLSAERIKELCAPPLGYVRQVPVLHQANPTLVPVKRRKLKPDRKYAIKQEIIDKIQAYRRKHPDSTYQKIADHFKVGLNTAYYSINRLKSNAS
jgi:hypothetical protein